MRSLVPPFFPLTNHDENVVITLHSPAIRRVRLLGFAELYIWPQIGTNPFSPAPAPRFPRPIQGIKLLEAGMFI